MKALSNKMANWLRWKDGCHVLLADKSEAGWYFIPDRGYSPETNNAGEYTPEHVHYDYLHTNVYEKEGPRANHGQFLPPGKWNEE